MALAEPFDPPDEALGEGVAGINQCHLRALRRLGFRSANRGRLHLSGERLPSGYETLLVIWQSPEWSASPEESVAVGNAEGVDNFVVGGDSPFSFEESINKLATHHVTLGCNPPDNDRFCPERTLTRGEMASFFARALDL